MVWTPKGKGRGSRDERLRDRLAERNTPEARLERADSITMANMRKVVDALDAANERRAEEIAGQGFARAYDLLSFDGQKLSQDEYGAQILERAIIQAPDRKYWSEASGKWYDIEGEVALPLSPPLNWETTTSIDLGGFSNVSISYTVAPVATEYMSQIEGGEMPQERMPETDWFGERWIYGECNLCPSNPRARTYRMMVAANRAVCPTHGSTLVRARFATDAFDDPWGLVNMTTTQANQRPIDQLSNKRLLEMLKYAAGLAGRELRTFGDVAILLQDGLLTREVQAEFERLSVERPTPLGSMMKKYNDEPMYPPAILKFKRAVTPEEERLIAERFKQAWAASVSEATPLILGYGLEIEYPMERANQRKVVVARVRKMDFIVDRQATTSPRLFTMDGRNPVELSGVILSEYGPRVRLAVRGQRLSVLAFVRDDNGDLVKVAGSGPAVERLMGAVTATHPDDYPWEGTREESTRRINLT